MNILELFQSFQTDEQAIDYLETVRWRGRPVCPYCKSENVGHHASGDRKNQRWQCRDCSRAFAVTVGTIFHGTHMPLRKWYMLIALMLNAKKSASSYQISRDLGIRRPTVWTMMHRVRLAMASDQEQADLLHGIVEADETYIGGKPRKGNKRDDDTPNKRGRGTKKTAVIGIAERLGNVIAKVAQANDLSANGLLTFVCKFVDTGASLVITDEYAGYNALADKMRHARINHSVQYADGMIHTNTIEGFWSLVKRAWYGSHHHYSKKYMGLYIAEACYKYNVRNQGESFGQMLAIMVAA